MNICFTGTMDMTRDDETEKFKKFGIEVKNTVTKKTDVLIKGWHPGNSKLDKAKKYNIPVMYEKDFFVMLRDEYPEFFL